MRMMAVVACVVSGMASAQAEEVLPHMISSKGLINLLPGNSFIAKARSGLVGVLSFGRDGRVFFKGRDNGDGKAPPDDIGVFRISETGYCSRWKLNNFQTRCFMVSPLRHQRFYQVWTVYGDRVDRLQLLDQVEIVVEPKHKPSQPMVLHPPEPDVR